MQEDLFNILDNDVKLNRPIQEIEEDRLKVVDEFVKDNTKHEAVINSIQESEYTPLNTEGLFTAKEYSFELDTFQKLAIAAIEADRSILVSAHTSCGKTVVAEYAIAKSIANNQRVIYTSPIKALSNQKYRELQEEFGDVGLMTGDVTLNPEATCLVMTTEILRNMLYRSSEITREIHWIIFDEIHYLKDRERGVVWEETLILLEKHVRMVFLSATIPNAREFAEWISKTQSQTVHVVYTEKRVIPLEHFFYSDELRLIKGVDSGIDSIAFYKSQCNIIRRNELSTSLNNCLRDVKLPAVVFSFARAKCEALATKLSLDKSLLTREETDLATTIFENAIQSLSEQDQELQAVQKMKDLFLKGIGVHHSGLLPIVKEIGEILFQEGLIKILFATESFSIGLNMPAKTVLFTALKKFDGVSERILTSGEYCQMSGRAGRRGIDTSGTVVSLVTAKLTDQEIIGLFQSTADPLNSAFRLTYNMILNLMRVEELDPTYFLSRSFYHYQAYRKAITTEKELRDDLQFQTEVINSLPEKILDKCEDIYGAITHFILLNLKRAEKVTTLCPIKENQAVSVICSTPGAPVLIERAIIVGVPPEEEKLDVEERVIEIKVLKDPSCEDDTLEEGEIHGKSLVKRFRVPELSICKHYGRHKPTKEAFLKQWKETRVPTNQDKEIDAQLISLESLCPMIYQCLIEGRCLLCGKTATTGCSLSEEKCMAYGDSENTASDIHPQVLGNSKDNMFAHQIFLRFFSSDSNSNSNNNKYSNTIYNNSESLIEDISFLLTYRNLFLKHKFFQRTKNHRLSELGKLKEIYHMDECKNMIGVLRDLEFLDGNTVLLKGKMASEISSADEILLTEMIFSSAFNSLNIIDMVALISILVTERSNEGDAIIVSEENNRLVSLFRESITKIVSVMNKNNIHTDEETYTSSYYLYMMDIVRDWMGGATFAEITSKTKVFEGSIIRGFKRLEEILRQLSSAAQVIGNNELVNLFGQGIYLIKRDIVFANSLYI